MSSKRCLALFTVVLSLVLLVPCVKAGQLSWTSTSDFDVGTKSQSDGNYGIETSTDNLLIGSGVFTLGNSLYDTFSIADLDANTFKWTPRVQGACSTSQSISGGVLTTAITSTSVSCFSGVTSDGTLSGATDLDVRTKLTSVTTIARIHLINEPAKVDMSAGASAEGVLYQWDAGQLRAFRIANGVATQCGTNTASPATPIWLRTSRVVSTDTWTFYYSTNGASWTTDETCVQAAIGPMYTALLCAVAGGSTCSDSWDDYYVATGTAGASTYQTAGSWTSGLQRVDQVIPDQVHNIVSNVTITYSGASVTNYIDAIDIVDIDGHILNGNALDRTSGTSVTILYDTTDVVLRKDWAVRITLAGGGAGSPTISSVDVTTVNIVVGGGVVVGTTQDLTVLITFGAIFILTAILGFAKKSPAVLIISAIGGYFTAFQSFSDLNNLPISIITSGVASFVLLMSIGMLSNRERV